jgi:hypothetical protein
MEANILNTNKVSQFMEKSIFLDGKLSKQGNI